MTNYLSPLIEAEELAAIAEQPNLIIIDADGMPNGYEQYLLAHPKGARFATLNHDMATIPYDFSQGGRHPLPDLQAFAKTLGNMGIEPDSHVIVYDRSSAANAAARFWFMLHAVGHPKVQVLNGGFKTLAPLHYPLESGIAEYPKTKAYPVRNWTPALVNMDEVEQMLKQAHQVVIDVRDAYRYRGESEPFDLVAGHIPGAINIPYSENLDAAGLYRPSEQIAEHYARYLNQENSQQAVVYCGSGVTACHTLLALAHAGFALPKLYVGSWSEWSRNKKQEDE